MANDRMPSAREESSSKRLRLDESDVKNMSSRQYMDELVVPTMLRALSAVNKERPSDPIEFLIAYLSKEREKTTVSTPLKEPSPPKPEQSSSSSGTPSATEEKPATTV